MSVFVVGHNPLTLLKANRFLNGKFPEGTLVTESSLAIGESDLRSRKDLALEGDRSSLNLDAPLLQSFLLEEGATKLLDLIELLLRVLPAAAEDVSHGSRI